MMLYAVAKGVFVWNKDIVRAGKKVGQNDVVVKPIRMVFGQSGFKAFAYWVNMFGKELQQKGGSLSYPIIVDRLYELTDIEHGFDYCMDYDIEDGHHILGEHIGLMINSTANDGLSHYKPESDKIKVWKPMQLLDVDKYLENPDNIQRAKLLTDQDEGKDDVDYD